MEQARLEEKGILWASAKEQALGRSRTFERVKDSGDIRLDGQG